MMNPEELWQKALRETEIVRVPIKKLITFGVSSFEYIFFAPSVVNHGDTVKRSGRMNIDRPNIITPSGSALFEGFDALGASGQTQEHVTDEMLSKFFYVRGISFPPLNYKNEQYEVALCDGSVAQAVKRTVEDVRMRESIDTGIVIGHDDAWQFSVLFLACHMIDMYVDADLRALLDRMRRPGLS